MRSILTSSSYSLSTITFLLSSTSSIFPMIFRYSSQFYSFRLHESSLLASSVSRCLILASSCLICSRESMYFFWMSQYSVSLEDSLRVSWSRDAFIESQ